MKKKVREITVGQKNYVWLVREVDFPLHALKVWMNEDKKYLVCELSFCTLSEFQSISPKVVKAVIENIYESFVIDKKTIQLPLTKIYQNA